MRWLIDILARWLTGRKIDAPKPQPKPDPTPDPDQPPADDPWALMTVHEAPQSVASWPASDTLKVELKGSLIKLTVGQPKNAALWPNGGYGCCVWFIVKRDGIWHGDPCDWLKSVNGIHKEQSCACIGKSNDRIMVPEESDERFGIAVSIGCRGGKTTTPPTRTSIVWFRLAKGKWEAL